MIHTLLASTVSVRPFSMLLWILFYQPVECLSGVCLFVEQTIMSEPISISQIPYVSTRAHHQGSGETISFMPPKGERLVIWRTYRLPSYSYWLLLTLWWICNTTFLWNHFPSLPGWLLSSDLWCSLDIVISTHSHPLYINKFEQLTRCHAASHGITGYSMEVLHTDCYIFILITCGFEALTTMFSLERFYIWCLCIVWFQNFDTTCLKSFFHIDSLRCALMSISLLSLPIQPYYSIWFGHFLSWINSSSILKCAWIIIIFIDMNHNVVWPLSKLNQLSISEYVLWVCNLLKLVTFNNRVCIWPVGLSAGD